MTEHFNLLNKREHEFLDNKVLLIASGVFNFFVYFFIWNLIYFIYHYVTKSRKQQLDTLRLESMVKELELKTIKAHINPHFIFNSLNSIRALVDENPQRARNAVTELSNILRSSMQTEQLETVPLERELGIIKDYLALENMRFEDRLKVEYDIDEDTLNQPVPPMMLQTLVENAIKHGISKQINGGLAAIERQNIAKAKMLYDCIDASSFYANPVRKEDRSRMNVPFTLKDSALDEEFLKGAGRLLRAE